VQGEVTGILNNQVTKTQSPPGFSPQMTQTADV